MNSKTLLAVLMALLGLCATSAWAERDIVYSARYYTGTSADRFHLYRIDPDGRHRTQITFGAHNDTDPTWSPDGKSILFTRDGDIVCVVGEGGGHVRNVVKPIHGVVEHFVTNVRWWPDSKGIIVPTLRGGEGAVVDLDGRTLSRFPRCAAATISPDGDNAYVDDGGGGSAAVLSDDHKLTIARRLALPVVTAAWITPEAIVGVTEGEGDASDGIAGFDENGSRLWTREVSRQSPAGDNLGDLGAAFRQVIPIPGDMRNVILGEVARDTVQPAYSYWRTSVDTGKATLLLSAYRFFLFQPSGQSYLTLSCPLIDSESGPKYHVPISALSVGRSAADSLPPSVIVGGLVMVEAADWRR